MKSVINYKTLLAMVGSAFLAVGQAAGQADVYRLKLTGTVPVDKTGAGVTLQNASRNLDGYVLVDGVNTRVLIYGDAFIFDSVAYLMASDFLFDLAGIDGLLYGKNNRFAQGKLAFTNTSGLDIFALSGSYFGKANKDGVITSLNATMTGNTDASALLNRAPDGINATPGNWNQFVGKVSMRLDVHLSNLRDVDAQKAAIVAKLPKRVTHIMDDGVPILKTLW